jgi:hypothetical protein
MWRLTCVNSRTGRRAQHRCVDGSLLLSITLSLAALAVALFALVRWRRVARITGARVLIGEAMRRRDIMPADAEAARLEPELFAAQQRCVECAAEPACRYMLMDAPQSANLPEACPNREFFDRVAAHKALSK